MKYAPAIEVFLVSAMTTLISGGMTVRTACGRITDPSVCENVSPMLRAASAWPTGTLLMPERIASAKNGAV